MLCDVTQQIRAQKYLSNTRKMGPDQSYMLLRDWLYKNTLASADRICESRSDCREKNESRETASNAPTNCVYCYVQQTIQLCVLLCAVDYTIMFTAVCSRLYNYVYCCVQQSTQLCVLLCAVDYTIMCTALCSRLYNYVYCCVQQSTQLCVLLCAVDYTIMCTAVCSRLYYYVFCCVQQTILLCVLLCAVDYTIMCTAVCSSPHNYVYCCVQQTTQFHGRFVKKQKLPRLTAVGVDTVCSFRRSFEM